jgi:hypothetical protein
MPKRIKQRWPDLNELSRQIIFSDTQTQSTKEPTSAELSRVMAALGRKGGKIGGRRRMETMTAEQRKDIASKAAKTRWNKRER